MLPLWKTVWRFLKKSEIELIYDPYSPFLNIYPKETRTVTRKDILTPMLTAALFTIARTWKQPGYPLTDEWIKKTRNLYAMEYYSAIKGTHLSQFW